MSRRTRSFFQLHPCKTRSQNDESPSPLSLHAVQSMYMVPAADDENPSLSVRTWSLLERSLRPTMKIPPLSVRTWSVYERDPAANDESPSPLSPNTVPL